MQIPLDHPSTDLDHVTLKSVLFFYLVLLVLSVPSFNNLNSVLSITLQVPLLLPCRVWEDESSVIWNCRFRGMTGGNKKNK